MIRALLVDDEINNLENLEFLLNNDCSGIAVAGKVQNATEARNWLKQNTPDVIFLDIQMPGENGFELLQSLPHHSYKIVFVTAYNEHALQAIKANALDYLVKPVDISELQVTVEKLKASSAPNDQQKLVEHFLQSLNKPSNPSKIALPQLGGITFIETDDIVSLQADSNYTILHLSTMQKMVISKTLKDFEELLDANQFVRIHKSYMVNLKYIKEYSTSDGGVVKMNDGNQWSVSRRQIDLFLEKMKAASLMFGK